jgi:hypothetical protein
MDSELKNKSSGIRFSQNPLSLPVTELFQKKPKRRFGMKIGFLNNFADKVMLGSDIRTHWVNTFLDMNNFWESSESRKEYISFNLSIKIIALLNWQELTFPRKTKTEIKENSM